MISLPEPPLALGLPARALRRILREEALAFVDSTFGPAGEWPSPLIAYRLGADFQSDWKEEVGHWLKSAEGCGYLGALLDRIRGRAKAATGSMGIDANDAAHLMLSHELAPAMVTHYLVGTGWTFCGWEPITGGTADVDLSLTAPDGRLVYLQVKSPDQPGFVSAGRRVDGEYEERPLIAMAKGASQLRALAGSEVKLVVLSANRTWPLSRNAESIVGQLIGNTVKRGSTVTLPEARRGDFWSPGWRHVSGVVLLDYVRSVDAAYSCTVLLNPKADVPASAAMFPHAAVCCLEGSVFRWVGGEPGRSHTLPSGTRLE